MTRVITIGAMKADEMEEARLVERQRPFTGPDDPRVHEFHKAIIPIINEYGLANVMGLVAFSIDATAQNLREQAIATANDPALNHDTLTAMQVARLAGALHSLIERTIDATQMAVPGEAPTP